MPENPYTHSHTYTRGLMCSPKRSLALPPPASWSMGPLFPRRPSFLPPHNVPQPPPPPFAPPSQLRPQPAPPTARSARSPSTQAVPAANATLTAPHPHSPPPPHPTAPTHSPAQALYHSRVRRGKVPCELNCGGSPPPLMYELASGRRVSVGACSSTGGDALPPLPPTAYGPGPPPAPAPPAPPPRRCSVGDC